MSSFKSEVVLKFSFILFVLLTFNACALVNRIESGFRSDDTEQELQVAQETSTILSRTAEATRQSRRDLAGDPDLDEIAKELEKIEEQRKSIGAATATNGEVKHSSNKMAAKVKETQTAAAQSARAEQSQIGSFDRKPALTKAKEMASETMDAGKNTASSALSKVKSLLGVGADDEGSESEATDSEEAETEMAKAEEVEEAETEIADEKKESEAKLAEAGEEASDEADDKLAKALEEAEDSISEAEKALEEKSNEVASVEEELAKTLAEEKKAAERVDARASLASMDDGQSETVESVVSEATETAEEGKAVATQTKIPVWVFLLMAAALSIAGFGLLWVSRNTQQPRPALA